jgi:hypothetical protein
MVDERKKPVTTFPFNPKFMIVVISKATSEEELLENVGFIPHIDSFHKIIVENAQQHKGTPTRSAVKNRVFRDAEAAEIAF